MLPQYLAALILALAVSILLALVDQHVAVRPGMAAPERHIAPERRDAHPTPAISAAVLPPELATCKAFDDTVRRALTNLCDPTRLSLSPLLQLSIVATGLHDQGLEDTRFHRVAILKAALTDLVNGLRPQCQADGCTGAACRFYNCLYYPYVLGVTRRRAPAVLRELRERRERAGGPSSEQEQVLTWLLQVDEDTYYKWQRRASDAIAGALREREAAAGGMAHPAGAHAVRRAPARRASA